LLLHHAPSFTFEVMEINYKRNILGLGLGFGDGMGVGVGFGAVSQHNESFGETRRATQFS
jgi:hypothetical protein